MHANHWRVNYISFARIKTYLISRGMFSNINGFVFSAVHWRCVLYVLYTKYEINFNLYFLNTLVFFFWRIRKLLLLFIKAALNVLEVTDKTLM